MDFQLKSDDMQCISVKNPRFVLFFHCFMKKNETIERNLDFQLKFNAMH